MFNLKKMKATIRKASKNGLLIGVGSILNIIPTQASVKTNYGCHPDVKALKDDWASIGKDFNESFKKLK